jgi:hypothetical protein
MEFFIQQNATLPILKMEVVKDGRTDSWSNFNGVLENATLRFSMKNEETGIQKVFMKSSHITQKIKVNPDSNREYYIYYLWDQRDTSKKGRYIGEFSIILENGELISPIREVLYINII